MKIGFIIVLYKTPEMEVRRLTDEIKLLGFRDIKIYWHDNTFDNRGFPYGVNRGLKTGLKDNVDLFILVNPDVSLKGLSREALLDASKHFDIYGLATRQENIIYYGGVIDKWRLSGGLQTVRPADRFTKVDFVPGSLMIIRSEVIKKTGFFDESYFMYYEDVDFCMRAQKEGFKVGIDSHNFYDHFENSVFNPEKVRWLEKNRWKLFIKYSTVKQKARELIRLPKTLMERRSKFFVNFMSMNFSALLNKVLHFLWFIFLVRMISPADYGTYSLAWAQIALLSPVLDLGTTSYGIVYLADNRQKISFSHLFTLRFILSIAVFILTVLLSFVFGFKTDLIFYVFLLSFVTIANAFSGSFLILNSINEKLYLSSALSVIFNLILIPVLIVSLFIKRNIAVVFTVNFLLYSVYGIINLYFIKKETGVNYFPKTILWKSKFANQVRAWKLIIRKSYVFVLISLFAGFYYRADVFLLHFMKGQKEVGLYSAGYKFLDALMFIAGSYNLTATPLFAKLAKTNFSALKFKLKKDLIFLATIGFAIAVGLFIAAPHILPYFLKGEFGNSIQVVRIVIFALPFVLMTSVFFNTLYVFEKAFYVVYLFLTQIIINLVLNIIFIPRYSYFASAYVSVIAEVINTSIAFILLLKVLKTHENRS